MRDLAPGFKVRRPTRDDAPAISALISARNLAEYGKDTDPRSPEQILAGWEKHDPAANTWVIDGPERLVAAYAYVNDRDPSSLWSIIYVSPDHAGRGIGSTLLRLVIERGHDLAATCPAERRVTLSQGVNPANDAAVRLLTALGFTHEVTFWMMSIELDAPPPNPAWPEGVTVRTVHDEDDLRLCYAVQQEAFQDHWGFEPVSFEEWRSAMHIEKFERDLIWMAVAGDEVAGVAFGMIGENGDGWVSKISVRRAWRRRGLGNGLLAAAFQSLYARGARRVELGVDGDSPTSAQRIYLRAGMRHEMSFGIYSTVLHPGTAQLEA